MHTFSISRRVAATCALAVAAVLGSAAPAFAAKLYGGRGLIEYTADPGEANDVRISARSYPMPAVPGALMVEVTLIDSGAPSIAVTFEPQSDEVRCSRVANGATCLSGYIYPDTQMSLQLSLGDQNDRAVLDPSSTALSEAIDEERRTITFGHVYGGAGNDTLIDQSDMAWVFDLQGEDGNDTLRALLATTISAEGRGRTS